jgi:hypothetical protein
MKELFKSKKLSRTFLCIFIGTFLLDAILYFSVAQSVNTYDTFWGVIFRMLFYLLVIALCLFVVARIIEHLIISKSEKSEGDST